MDTTKASAILTALGHKINKTNILKVTQAYDSVQTSHANHRKIEITRPNGNKSIKNGSGVVATQGDSERVDELVKKTASRRKRGVK
jgi:predicted flavoprotein YhiN